MNKSEKQLEELFACYVDRLNEGEKLDADTILAENPYLGPELLTYLDEYLDADSNDPSSAPLGTLGDYTLRRQIGRGGMGVVYEAWENSMDRAVALKILLEEHRDNDEFIQRFHQEAKITVKLEHPGIVPVHQVGEYNEHRPYFVMKLVKGKTLNEILKSRVENRQDLVDIFEQICQTLAYAHSEDVIHRDLKPSNVMVGSFGEVQVMDWGLAKDLAEETKKLPSDETRILTQPSEDDGPNSRPGEVMGTLAYMSPEQALGDVCSLDKRSDVFGLGAILCEILTGIPPYTGTREEIHQKAKKPDLTDAFKRLRDSGADLDVIDLAKACLSEHRNDRPADAGIVATQIDAYKKSLESRARSAEIKASKARTKAAAAFVVSIFAVVFGVVIWIFAGLTAQEHRLSNLLTTLRVDSQNVRVTMDETRLARRNRISREAARIRADERLRSESIAALPLLDADFHRSIDGGASFVHVTDSHIFFAPLSDNHEGRVLDVRTGHVQSSGIKGVGPFAVRADGTIVQLTAYDSTSYTLWDWNSQQSLCRFQAPSSPIAVPGDRSLISLSPDGRFAAAGVLDKPGRITVWNAETADPCGPISESVSALAFSPGGEFVATADDTGRVTIRSLPRLAVLLSFQATRSKVYSLEFGRDPRVRRYERPNARLLAVGDAGGTITVWSVNPTAVDIVNADKPQQRTVSSAVISVCKGSRGHIYDIAFSPDGMTVASCGRYQAALWDIASGESLLELGDLNTMTSLAFSPDSKMLVVGSQTAHGSPGKVEIWNLTSGPGVHVLRGLNGPVVKIVLSEHGLIAALSEDWLVGIWDMSTGHLLHVLEVPPGDFSDSADFVFSPDEQHLAFSCGRSASLWCISPDSVEVPEHWKLPTGLVDRLAFHPDGQLLLFRVETEGGELPPYSNAPVERYPRVCNIRDLRNEDYLNPIKVIKDFKWGINTAVMGLDGRLFVVEGGAPLPNAKYEWGVRTYESRTGKELEARSMFFQSTERSHYPAIRIDPTGRFLSLCSTDGERVVERIVVDLESGEEVDRIPIESQWQSYSSTLRYQGRYVYNEEGDYQGFAIFLKGQPEPIMRLGVHSRTPWSVTPVFASDGNRITWGDYDGRITVLNFNDVRRDLKDLGLAWEN